MSAAEAAWIVARSPVAGLIGITLAASNPGALFGIDGVANRIVRLAVDAASRAVTPAGEIKLGETAALIEAPQFAALSFGILHQ